MVPFSIFFTDASKLSFSDHAMGKCRFNDAMKNDFPWALSVHGNPHAVRCRCCNQELNISKGTAVLSRHQETGRHVSASAAAQSQPTIRQQVAQQNDKETIKQKALILHVLKILLFLLSPLTRYMYTLYERVEKDSDLSTFYDNIEKLASSVGVNPKAIVDEIATLFVSSGSVCIFELFTSKSLENHQSVRQLCEFNILVVPHNMQVESGFSEMKLAESKYQNHFLLDT